MCYLSENANFLDTIETWHMNSLGESACSQFWRKRQWIQMGGWPFGGLCSCHPWHFSLHIIFFHFGKTFFMGIPFFLIQIRSSCIDQISILLEFARIYMPSFKEYYWDFLAYSHLIINIILLFPFLIFVLCVSIAEFILKWTNWSHDRKIIEALGKFICWVFFFCIIVSHDYLLRSGSSNWHPFTFVPFDGF